MKIGTRVQITDKHAYNGRFYLTYGTVVHTNIGNTYFFNQATKVAVEIDGVKNPRSKYNAYWFPAMKLTELDTVKRILPGYYTVVNIQPLDTDGMPIYECALYDTNVSLGDIVVVKDIKELSLFRVVEITKKHCKPIAYGREIIAKADFSDYYCRQAIAQRLAELEKDIAKYTKKLKGLSIYESMAAHYPDVKAMLDEYKTIVEELGPNMV